MATAERLWARVRHALARALPDDVEVDVGPPLGGLVPTFKVTVAAGPVLHRFTVGWAGEGWPADVARLATLAPEVEVVIAANLSDGARAWLSDRHLAWVDEAGRADLRRPSGLVIVREIADRPRRTSATERWNRSMLAVSEAALTGVEPTVEAIETATGLSRNATAGALKRLEELGLLHRPGARRGPTSGRRIADASALLDAYADAASQLRAKRPPALIHRTWRDPLETLRTEIGPALDAGGNRWAVTGAGASTLLAPHLSDITTLEVYVDADLLADRPLLESLFGGRVVQKGHRIEVREFATIISADGPVVDGVHVALPVRVYADLLAIGGRAQEAAHHLRETLHVGTTA